MRTCTPTKAYFSLEEEKRDSNMCYGVLLASSTWLIFISFLMTKGSLVVMYKEECHFEDEGTRENVRKSEVTAVG